MYTYYIRGYNYVSSWSVQSWPQVDNCIFRKLKSQECLFAQFWNGLMWKLGTFKCFYSLLLFSKYLYILTFYTICFESVLVLSHVRLFVISWNVAHQAPRSIGFPRQEYWSGLPFPAPEDLSHPEIEPTSPALAGGFSTTEPPGKPPTSLPQFFKDTWLGSKTVVLYIIF